MEIKEKFVKGYEDKSFAELASAPVDAMKGISKKDAQMLYKAFHIKTVADLAHLKFARWAREICEYAESDPHGDTTSFKDKLIKKYEKTPLAKLPKVPVWALQGLSKKDAELLRKSFAIKTIRDLATLKYILWAQEIVDLARPQGIADIPVDEMKRPIRTIAGVILGCMLILLIIGSIIFWPHIRTLTGISKEPMPKEIPPFGERLVPQRDTERHVLQKEGSVTQPKQIEKEQILIEPSRMCDNCYTVKWRDTLITISAQLSGNWRNWKKLYELNRNVIKDVRKILPGTQLKLPEGFKKAQ